jgi:hypothetical protein
MKRHADYMYLSSDREAPAETIRRYNIHILEVRDTAMYKHLIFIFCVSFGVRRFIFLNAFFNLLFYCFHFAMCLFQYVFHSFAVNFCFSFFIQLHLSLSGLLASWMLRIFFYLF